MSDRPHAAGEAGITDRPRRGRALRRWMRRWPLLVLLVGAALAARAFWLEPAALRNHDTTLALPDWPARCGELRIVLMSDLHVGSPFNGIDKLARIVDLAAAARPELVLLAGDYVVGGMPGGRPVPPAEIARELARLDPVHGVFGVLGNHEYYAGERRIQGAFEEAGIPILVNRATALQRPGCRFWVAGVNDFIEGHPDLRAALQEVPADEPVLLLTHNPDIFPAVPDRVTLTLAGHTHGGQVRLPLVGSPIVPSLFGQRYLEGHIVEDGRHLFVTTGLGTSMLGVRFGVPPEISVLQVAAAGS